MSHPRPSRAPGLLSGDVQATPALPTPAPPLLPLPTLCHCARHRHPTNEINPGEFSVLTVFSPSAEYDFVDHTLPEALHMLTHKVSPVFCGEGSFSSDIS